jgi:alpha,alpha-trehalase
MLIATGLKDQGHNTEALAIRDRSARLFSASGFHEYYDPLTGQGLGGKKFSWTAATSCGCRTTMAVFDEALRK